MNNNSKPRILVLRHEKAGVRTLEKLDARGFSSARLPLSQMQYLDTHLKSNNFDALILTSPAVLPALQMHSQWEELKPKIVNCNLFCVGERTARLAKDAGFLNLQCVASHALELAHQIGKHEDVTRILYPCATHRSFDFSADKNLVSIPCTTWEIYHNKLLDPGRDKLSTSLLDINVILLYSARTARHFFNLSQTYNLQDKLGDLKFVAISAKVADEVPRNLGRNTYIADRRDENAIMDCLETICR